MAILLSDPLVLPETFEVIEESRYLGKYALRPLEPGYGTTIGNALRRVLLSSIEGYAIVGLKIPGVLHEFSVVEGVIEDVTDIVLNLKQVALRPKHEGVPPRIFVEIRHKEVFTAGELAQFAPYEVANPDLVLMNLDPSAVVQMELRIGKGRGYRLAEENKALLRDSIEPHEIILDTSFSPVIRVVPRVENILYKGRADYEQLLLEIETKGTVAPREALQRAIQILVDHFRTLAEAVAPQTSGSSPAGFPSPNPKPGAEIPKEALLRLLQTPIVELNLPITAGVLKSLHNGRIYRLAELVELTPADLEKFRGIGTHTIQQLEEALKRMGLGLGMDLSAYKPFLASST
ncbi:MAG: DNA-directed RNA polymerase subunit alpha [Bacteroidia bacterium]|nr:DNA-directed RNA polymerase subunit alpha [Bacteroidia bacterium]MDW8089680.1 DNA-directed RNA polymerase subunit alpha [Bacteroidia bacterium]